MKLKYIAYSALLAAVALGSTSCEDFLSKNPDNRVELSSPEQMQMLLVSGYMDGNIALMCELSSDNIVDNNAPNADGIRYNLSEYGRIDNEIFAFEDAVSDSQQDSPTSVWDGCYHAIACANEVLQRVAQYEAEGRGDEVSAVKGEALIIRAYHHFLLANMFCMPYRGPELSRSLQGIPYSLEPETTLSPNYDRGNLADVYDKIEADLEAGLPLINDAIYEQPKYHFNSNAAAAFAARFYLFKRDYVKAEQYATQVLGTEGAPVMSQLNDWWTKSFGNAEQSMQYFCSIERQSNLLILPTQSVFLRHIASSSRYSFNGEGADATFLSAGPSWRGGSGYFHAAYLGKLYVNGSQEYGCWSSNFYELFEYTDRIAGIGYPHIVRVEFSTEETLFVRAEARIYLGKIDEAVADLKVWDDVRKTGLASSYDRDFSDLSRSNIESFYGGNPGSGIVKPLHIDEVCPSDQYQVTPDIEPYLQCALHFRRIHLVGDGSRWFDIKRYGLEYTHSIWQSSGNTSGTTRVETLTMLDPRKAFQLPTEVLSSGMEATNRTVSADGVELVLLPLVSNNN